MDQKIEINKCILIHFIKSTYMFVVYEIVCMHKVKEIHYIIYKYIILLPDYTTSFFYQKSLYRYTLTKVISQLTVTKSSLNNRSRNLSPHHT